MSEKSLNPRHIVADPFQMEHYRGDGIRHLNAAGYSFTELMEEGSEVALPKLIEEYQGAVDVVFIDGWHTFDHTLLDLFYANRLLRKGGIVIVDDAGQAAVGKALSYFSQYPHMRLLGSTKGEGGTFSRRVLRSLTSIIPYPVGKFFLPSVLADAVYTRVRFGSMVAFEKVDDDSRPWDWYSGF